MNKRWKIVGLITENAIVVVLVLFIVSYSQSLAYTRVVVPLGTHEVPNDGVPYFHGEDKYSFFWGEPYAETSLFAVAHWGHAGVPFLSFPTSYYATYEVRTAEGGIAVKLLEVHSDCIVLLVKPL